MPSDRPILNLHEMDKLGLLTPKQETNTMPTTHDSNEGQTQYMTPEEQMRAEFEKWWQSMYVDMIVYDHAKNTYDHLRACGIWKAWQACAAKSAETIAALNDINSAQATMLGERNEIIASLNEENAGLAREALSLSSLNKKTYALLEEKEHQLAAAQADNARLLIALARIGALRDDIIARQSIGWSAHVYPLVAILDEVLPAPANQDV